MMGGSTSGARVGSAAPAGQPVPRAGEGIAPGTVFQGRYEILSALGEGGFGVVYEGRQLTTGQRVAIKVMRRVPGASATDARRRASRFQREMRFCARLHHPNIVRLIDSGQGEGEELYTVFEFVPGKNLAQVIADDGALDPMEARHLMLQVLDALSCAHAQGLVHRDIKPQNVMVVPTGARRNAIVLDFGIGVLVRRAPEGEANVTSSNEILCTPAYTAPEQIRGLPPTARSDLYAWGLVFLECLTGKPVFDGGSLEQVIVAQASPDPILIPAALAGHPLGTILRHATVKEVAARAATAGELLRGLEACDVAGLRRADFLQPPVPGADPSEQSPWEVVEEQPPPTAPSSARGAGERRLVTVVCCALSPAAPDRLPIDVEEMDDLFAEGQEICAGVAWRYQGQVTAGPGNQVILSFGDPVAREDDALRAAHAAREVATAVAAWSARIGEERGFALELRMGIHTGLVVVREGAAGTRRLGWTTQVAARLSGLAAPGTIIVSRDVHRLLCGWFTFERMAGELPEGGAVYRLQEEGTGTYPQLERMPLFGREQELDLLLDRWRQVGQGSGQVVLVTGEPGIGKSRLTLELVRRLRGETHLCLEGRCAPDRRTSTLHPIVEAIDRLLDDCAAAGRLDRLEALLSRRGFSLPETAPLLASLLSIPFAERYPTPADPPQRRKERTFHALLSLLFEVAQEQPILLLIEDLHWADPTSLEWLGALVQEAPSARVLALFTARPELLPPWPTSGMLQIQLGRLDRAYAERIVAHVAEDRALPVEVIEQIVGRADGVPLFVEELSRMVVESEGAPEDSKLAVPTTLQGLLMARFDRLGPAKETIQLAAVLGREFGQEVLSAASLLGATEVERHLDQLVAADLVCRQRRARGPAYLFKHALIRDAAYDSLPRRARQELHARVARTLEERFPAIARTCPGVLMLHHAAAEQKRQAIVYAERAAASALEYPTSAGVVEIEGHLQQALSWLTAIDDERERALTELRLNNLLVLAMLGRGGYGVDAAAVIERCQSLNDELGESSLIASWASFTCCHMAGQRREARVLAERILTTVERSADTTYLAWALSSLGECMSLEGRHADARRHIERALSPDERAVRRDPMFVGIDITIYARSTLSVSLFLMGEHERALTEGQVAVDAASDSKYPNTLGIALLYLAMIYHFAREREKVMDLTSRLTTLAERYLVGKYVWILRRWAEGDLDELNRCIAELQGFGYRLGQPHYLSMAAELRAEHGQHEAAIEQLDGCLQLAGEMGEMYYVPELYRLKAFSLQALGEHKTAESEACLRQAIALAREQGARMPEARSTLALCRSLDRQGRRGEVRALLGEICAWPVQHAGMPELAEARALLGELTGS